jgi:hypothetical protein
MICDWMPGNSLSGLLSFLYVAQPLTLKIAASNMIRRIAYPSPVELLARR